MAADRDKRVCVIGAGIAGLVAAKVLTEDGFEITVFEKHSELGGVWAASRTYPGLRANNPRETYAFSDFPYPETADDFPSAEQVRTYLRSYAEHFGLLRFIRLSTEVVSIKSVATSSGEAKKFEVVVRESGRNTRRSLQFDFVVVCNGVFSEPQMPHPEGRELFTGSTVHSSQIAGPETVEGKRVVVVGSGKSALDCAAWAAGHASKCTLVFKAPHWMVPRYFPGRTRVDRVIMTRFAELFLRYHRLSPIEKVLHGPVKFLVRAWWLLQSRRLRGMLKMPAALTPDAPLPQGFEYVGVGDELYGALDRGKLALRRARLSRFIGPAAVELDTGETLDADLVVFATGWRQDVPFLDAGLRSQVLKDGSLHLYRHILPPGQPRLGFIGYASSTACQLTSEVAAHWLSQWFLGELDLCDAEEMEQEISRVLEWAARTFPGRREGYYIGPFVAHYLDDLLRDMGLPTRRTGSFCREYFDPLWPDRYRDLGEQRRRLRNAGKKV